MTQKIEHKEIEAVISGMLGAFDADNLAAYEAVSQTPEVKAAVAALRKGDFDRFYFALQYPANKMIDGLIASEFVGGSHEIKFLFKNSKFVESHIRRLVEKHEGNGCCADKTRTVMRAILNFLKTGAEISFDYTQEYTFHLPKKVFTQHALTLQYFKSLQHLHSGRPELYFQALLAIELGVEDASQTQDPATSAPASTH